MLITDGPEEGCRSSTVAHGTRDAGGSGCYSCAGYLLRHDERGCREGLPWDLPFRSSDVPIAAHARRRTGLLAAAVLLGMMSPTIAVHGATGTQGSRIARRLTEAGHAVRALTRQSADLAVLESLEQAYSGVDAVVVSLPLVVDDTALVHADNVLAALERTRVARVVFNPGSPVPPAFVGIPYVDARVRLAQELPLLVRSTSIIAPAGPYLENLLHPWSVSRITQQGEVAYPIPAQARSSWVTLDDIGDAVGEALTAQEAPAQQLIGGPEPISGEHLAEAIGAVVGRPVRYVCLDTAEFRRLITPVLGAAPAAHVAALYEQRSTGPEESPLPADVVCAGTTTPEQWAARQSWAV
ncbi:NmrA family NAD(P)-binding protein [Streptomyces sp. NPDC005500]|uniref:SDR family oxidoreductase n=1 Tax=Streptomyces sp. NPDC005500 TaxID=3155007 RepID=UPI0033A2A977